MAVKEKKDTKTYVGARISTKQFKRYLATAPTPEAKRAIKSLYLSEPVKFYSKADLAAENEGVETDLPVKAK
ncbi:hypothetical protein [Xanthomonas phage X1]|nr:hypothetical protein [Xanthomonas phage X1]